jgi:hypothetical protein
MAHHVGWVLAHQGGWDEILFVLGPLLVFAGLLALARRRADQFEASRPDEARSDGDPGPDAEADPERGRAQR